MLKSYAFSLIRHGLQFGAGVLVAKGFVDASGADQLMGAGVALASVAWSVAEKHYAFLKA